MRIGIDPFSESEVCSKGQNIQAQKQKNLSLVVCQWSFVIEMTIDNWQMTIDKFFLLGLIPYATIYNAGYRIRNHVSAFEMGGFIPPVGLYGDVLK